MNYFQRRRYTVRYGNRRANALKCALAVVLIGALLAAFTYVRSHKRPSGPASFIITASATANEPAPVLSAAMVTMLQSAGQDSTKATASVVTAGSGQADVLPLTPYLADGDVDYGPTRAAALSANIVAVQQAVGRQAAQAPFDLLAGITAAIKAAPPPATVIVLSSGLSTAGGFDLRQVGWDASPGTVAAQLKSRGLLPGLTGYKVIFSGLGDTSGRQPALPLPAQTTLTSYWLTICQVADAASCTTDDTTRPELPSHSSTPVPVVPVPAVVSVRGPHHHTTITLPDTLLFTFNSAALIPAADSVLQPIARQARAQDELVTITGHASPDGGTADYNLALSRRRAEAVRDRLITLGLPSGQVTRVTGVGTAGQAPGACLIGGQLDEALCSQLRRVVIVLTPAPAAPIS
jgi:outer membrane protein OmpA-like peptidoglycan-associated protein